MRGYSFGLLLGFINTIAFPCLAAGTIFKWKIDKYLIAISISDDVTEVSSLKKCLFENSEYENSITGFSRD